MVKLNRRQLFQSMLALGAVALVPKLPLPMVEPRQLTLDDLVQMRERGEPISQSLLENVRHWENTHRNFGPCRFCSATTFKQHQEWCNHASLLFEEDWYEILKGRQVLAP